MAIIQVKSTRPPGLSGCEFTGLRLNSLASGRRSSVKFEPWDSKAQGHWGICLCCLSEVSGLVCSYRIIIAFYTTAHLSMGWNIAWLVKSTHNLIITNKRHQLHIYYNLVGKVKEENNFNKNKRRIDHFFTRWQFQQENVFDLEQLEMITRVWEKKGKPQCISRKKKQHWSWMFSCHADYSFMVGITWYQFHHTWG